MSTSLAAASIFDINTTAGQSSVAVTGDPAVALTAQVNRYLKATGYPEQPLQPGVVSIATGLTALAMMNARLIVALGAAPADERTAISTQINAIAAAQGDPVAFIMPRLDEITRTIAIWGDIQGYRPASVGITTRDPRIKAWYQKWWGIGLILVGVGAVGWFGWKTLKHYRTAGLLPS